MSEKTRHELASKRAKIRHILLNEERLDGYITLKTKHVLPALLRAEAKIREGTYGQCDECYDEIDSGRLEVAPGATRCIICQKDYEDKLRLRI